jgi:RNA polymerase sigma-70 factor (ECF subfamily)
VYTLCLRITKNSAEAEDLTQEVFLQLFRKVATFRGDSAFSTWLHRVAVNVALMNLRKKSLPMASEPHGSESGEGARTEIGATDYSLAASIDRILLERSAERLPPGYRVIFLLHDVEGYEHKEIARMMRCSVGNSKSQLHKARRKLRSHLQTRSAPGLAPRGVHTDALAACNVHASVATLKSAESSFSALTAYDRRLRRT